MVLPFRHRRGSKQCSRRPLFTIEMNDPLSDHLTLLAFGDFEPLNGNRQPFMTQHNSPRPVTLGLSDLESTKCGTSRQSSTGQSREYLLGAVEQSRFQIVLAKFVLRLIAHLFGQIHSTSEVLMDADRAIGLAAPTEQITQCKVKFGRFWVKPNDINKRVNGPVRFFIKQVVQAPKIRIRKAACLSRLLAQISPRGEPSEREQQRKDQQPPKLKLHRAINRLRQRSRSIDTGRLKRARRLSRLHRIDRTPQSADFAALSKQGGDKG